MTTPGNVGIMLHAYVTAMMSQATYTADLLVRMPYTGNPQLMLLMDPACLICWARLKSKAINYNESYKMKS